MSTHPYRIILSILICLSWPNSRAFSATPEEEALKQRVATLEVTVAELQRRLARLENPNEGTKSVAAKSKNENPWKEKANWRKLSIGMSKAELTQLLGEPGTINNFSSFEVWYYPSVLGGKVTIDESNGVSSWSEP